MIRLWDTASGALRTTINEEDAIYALEFSRNGSMLASGTSPEYSDDPLKLWRVADGQLIRSFRPTSIPSRLVFGPDGSSIFVGGWSFSEWDVSTGALVQSRDDPASWGCFNTDGTILACVSNGVVVLWDWKRRVQLGTLVGPKAALFPVEFSPDGTLIAAGSAGNTLTVWRILDMAWQQTMACPGFRANCLAFSPDGRTLVAGSAPYTGRMMLWDPLSGAVLADYDAETGHGILDIEYEPSGDTIAVARNDATVMVIRNPFQGTRLRGNVFFTDYEGDASTQVFEFSIKNASGQKVDTWTQRLSRSGRFFQRLRIKLDGGRCTLLVKGPHWLSKGVAVDDGNAEHLVVEPLNGDVDGDDAVTSFDLNALSDAFDSHRGQPTWSESADLDGDGAVTVYDYGIVCKNFDQVGDD